VKLLTKSAIAVTLLAVVALYVTGDVVQSLQVDSSGHRICVVTWHIPLYGTVRVQEGTWRTFTQIWLYSMLIPAMFWVLVGVRYLVYKFRSTSN